MINPGSPIADSDYGEGLIHKMTNIRNTFSSEALSGRTVFAALALAAVIAAGMLLLLPGSPLHAQDANTIEYPENGTDLVATFSSEDPDADTITWSVTSTGDEDFEIDEETGELEFMTPPNFESPAGGAGNDSNTYAVTVTATDDDSPTLEETKTVMVKVTDVDERATISLSTRQPVVGQALIATLENDDEVTASVRWAWEKKDGANWVDVAGTPASTDATEVAPWTSTYPPQFAEKDAELRVGVEYIDTDDDNQTIAPVAFERMVAASVGADNELPMFAEGPNASRTVAENAEGGTVVGDPVTATDDHRDALTYEITTTPAPPFTIDNTGQIRVKAGAELHFDDYGSATTLTPSFALTVSVADPDGADAGTIMVTVMVTDVAEAPRVTGPATKTVDEGMMDQEGPVAVDTYTGTDETSEAISLTLSGPDAGAFTLTRDNGSYDLALKAAPDFEKPADTGANNEYQVTVAAIDRGLRGMKAVVVSIKNVQEDGEIELSPAMPTVGKAVTAELEDVDGVQANTVTWVWSSKVDDCDSTATFERGDRITGATSDTYTPTAAECLRVTARYTDGAGMANASAEVTVGARTVNIPVFTDDDPIIRSVNENAVVGTEVGEANNAGNPDPVAATDTDTEDDGTDTLTFRIISVNPASGAALFGISNTGQLTTKAMLDHEEQASYVLEIQVSDSTSNTATVMVTVKVDDENDAPGDIVDSRRNDDYAENGTDLVATFSSTDPDDDTIMWRISGTDSGVFKIDAETGELEFATSPNFEVAADDGTNNTYELTVTATDDGTDGTDMLTATKDVTVKVTDVEERATISLSTRQPVVGQELTATLENTDEVTADNVRWTWSPTLTGTEPEDTDETSIYTPAAGDAGNRLRVGVKYIDSDEREQTIAPMSFERAVGATLPDPDDDGADNDSPMFAEDGPASRTVAENAAGGTAVGDPVTATDDHRDALTYEITTTPAPPFTIDNTGQIRVKAGAELHFDDYDSATTLTPSFALTVSVADPDGADAATIIVNVEVTDVAEAPKVTGPASKTVDEDFDSDDGSDEDERELVVATYMGTDEAGDAIGLTLEGADAGAFTLTRDNGSYNLAFNTAPDFEKPADTGANNEYQVTVVATDRGLKATRSVVVRVANVDEAGKIELSPAMPTVGKAVTAELEDEDGVQANTVTWVWSSNVSDPCNDMTTFNRGDRITGATSDTYTPAAAECLRVTARYTDGAGMTNASAEVTVGARTVNIPVFTDDDPIIRSVNENAVVGTEVGEANNAGNPDPVAATDTDTEDDGTDTLAFNIISANPASGAALFSIDNMGQLTTKAMLDHEEQASYVLEIQVSDSTGNTATVMVTVNVNGVNEAPGTIMFTRGEVTNTAPEFASASAVRTVAEDAAVGADIGAAVEAADAGDTLTYTLGGTDAASFDIGSATGQLMTAVALDFETKTSYSVRVTATDSADASDFIDVTINVTDVDEEVVVQPGQTLLDRSDTDDDGEISKTEVVVAFREYIDSDGQIDKMEMIDVFRQYVEDQTG